MRRSAKATTSLLIALAASNAAAQQVPLDNLREMEKQGLIERHRALLAPTPLPPETFLAWAEESGLDESQRQSLAETVDAYALRLPSLEKDLRSKILELWHASFEFDREARAIVPVSSPQLLELYDLHRRLVERVLDLERPIVTAIASQVDPARQRAIDSAWLARLRRLRGLTPPASPLHTLDPTGLVDRLDLDDAERGQLETVIAQYRRNMIAALEGRETLAPLEAEASAAAMLVELGPEWELFFAPHEIADIEGQMRASRKPAMLDRVAQLNHQFIHDAADLLPPRQSIELRSLYFQRLLPDFFEEEREMLALADTIAKLLADIAGEEGDMAREALARTLQTAAKELDPTAESAVTLAEAGGLHGETLVDRAHDSQAAILSAVAQLEREHDLLQLRRERRRVIDRAVESLQTTAQHSPEYQALRDTFEQLRRIQKAREEADEFRQNAAAERIAGLAALLREREDE